MYRTRERIPLIRPICTTPNRGGGDLGDYDTTLPEVRDELAIAAFGNECKGCFRKTSLTKMPIRNFFEGDYKEMQDREFF